MGVQLAPFGNQLLDRLGLPDAGCAPRVAPASHPSPQYGPFVLDGQPFVASYQPGDLVPPVRYLLGPGYGPIYEQDLRWALAGFDGFVTDLAGASVPPGLAVYPLPDGAESNSIASVYSRELHRLLHEDTAL